jgi:serine palmitoyltransferase
MVPEKTTKKSINLGSYNYLGFAENSGPITDQVIETCKKYGMATCSSRQEVCLLN